MGFHCWITAEQGLMLLDSHTPNMSVQPLTMLPNGYEAYRSPLVGVPAAVHTGDSRGTAATAGESPQLRLSPEK